MNRSAFLSLNPYLRDTLIWAGTFLLAALLVFGLIALFPMTKPVIRKRVVASVTWAICPEVMGHPHLGELSIFEGADHDLDGIMRHPTLWKAREFMCQFCKLHARLTPMAILITDVPVI